LSVRLVPEKLFLFKNGFNIISNLLQYFRLFITKNQIKNDLYIYYSAESKSLNLTHSSVLYFIQAKLRVFFFTLFNTKKSLLNLKHRVPLDEPSLRTMFGVMLEIAQQEKDFYVGRESRVFLILDGVDHLMNEGEDLFWLPEYFLGDCIFS